MAEEHSIPTGSSTNKPPFFDGSDYPYWKNHMQMFIESTNYRLWEIIETGNNVPKTDAGEVIKKEDSTDAHKKENQLNTKTNLFLQCTPSRAQLDKVDCLKTAKEIWDALGVAYEGTTNVWQTKVSLLVAEYETFMMKASMRCLEGFRPL